MECFDNLESIPNLTSIALRGKFEAETLSKIVSFLEENPQYRKRIKLKPSGFRPCTSCQIFGKPHVLKNLLNKLENLGINISVKLLLIHSFADINGIDKITIQNAIKNLPEQLKQYTLGDGGHYSQTLSIKGNGSSAYLFSSGRIIFTTDPERMDHITFRDEIIKAISECDLGK
jgi:hypothetical protein